MILPKLYLLELRFRAISPIRSLPHYHGPQLRAMLDFALKPYLLSGLTFAETGTSVHPVETGVSEYHPGDPIHLGLTFPRDYAEPIVQMLQDFNNLGPTRGHFQPAETIILKEILCRISGRRFTPEDMDASLLSSLSPDLLSSEIEILMENESFSICFHAPLRMYRPKGFKKPGHQYVDPEFFLGTAAHPDPLLHLARSVPLHGHELPGSSGLRISGGALTFLDNTYGDFKTPIGGIMGLLHISGRASLPVAEALVAGQYLGIGKNRTFGLGFYYNP